MKKTLEDIFVTEGVPQFTFVKPPNYNEILVDMRRAGKPVIIEGQSGTGKTSTARKIIEQLKGEVEIKYLSARKATDVESIIRLISERTEGFYIIDDFHRLSKELQLNIGDLAKIAAEEGIDTALPKLIIIGINQIGSGLIHLVPDIAKRCGIHRIDAGNLEDITTLIDKGCTALNIQISDKQAIFKESKGDYWLTQVLCQAICSLNDVLVTAPSILDLSYNIEALRQKVTKRLEAGYYEPVKEFCRGRRFRKSNDPYFKLLKLIGQQSSSIVDLNKLANQHEDVKGSINNIKERRLEILLDDKESLNRYFYYNSDTKNFAIEDPALFYYIKHLDWDKLRDDCGFVEGAKDYEFDIAISFAGENRELAKQFAEKFQILDASVFFDELYETNLLGKSLTKQFAKIFNDDSRFVVCLLDRFHADKVWPTFERDTFVHRVAEGAIIPIYLDETKFVGIPNDLYGVDLRKGMTEAKIDESALMIVIKIS